MKTIKNNQLSLNQQKTSQNYMKIGIQIIITILDGMIGSLLQKNLIERKMTHGPRIVTHMETIMAGTFDILL